MAIPREYYIEGEGFWKQKYSQDFSISPDNVETQKPEDLSWGEYYLRSGLLQADPKKCWQVHYNPENYVTREFLLVSQTPTSLIQKVYIVGYKSGLMNISFELIQGGYKEIQRYFTPALIEYSKWEEPNLFLTPLVINEAKLQELNSQVLSLLRRFSYLPEQQSGLITNLLQSSSWLQATPLTEEQKEEIQRREDEWHLSCRYRIYSCIGNCLFRFIDFPF